MTQTNWDLGFFPVFQPEVWKRVETTIQGSGTKISASLAKELLGPFNFF